MYFKFSDRTNPKTNRWEGYYRLMNQIARTLTQMHERKATLFPQTDPNVTKWVHELWSRIFKDCRLDLTLYDPQNRMVHLDTIQHKYIREIRTEWICYNTWHKLEINKVLEENDFSEEEIRLAQTQIISRAVHPASELAMSQWIKENSAITEITGFSVAPINVFTRNSCFKYLKIPLTPYVSMY